MQHVMSLEGKTIVVTGAAQGIGQAMGRLAIDLGARVVGVDLNGDKLDAFAKTTNGKLLPMSATSLIRSLRKRRFAMSRRASAPLTVSSIMPALRGLQ
jgi:short-subunit dehydrogenase